MSQTADELASAYQPRRTRGAILSVAYNLLLIGGFLALGGADALARAVGFIPAASPPRLHTVAPLYFFCFFALYALANLPLELWYGYLEERHFGLAKEGVRAWARDALIGQLQHGVLFFAGACFILILQILLPPHWVFGGSVLLLILFLATSYFSADLLPLGLFQVEPPDAATRERLDDLLNDEDELPPVLIYSAPTQREFNGGLIGLGRRQVLLLSRSTLDHGSGELLRFVLLHELGHRRGRHVLLATLIGWLWIGAGLWLSSHLIPGRHLATPPYVAWLALTLSGWMLLGQPVLAWVSRRLELAADRHFLRRGGTLEQMHAALHELAARNLVSTRPTPWHDSVFRPIPSVSARLAHAERFTGELV